MATLKLTIDKRRALKDGKYPIVFRLTSFGRSTCIDANARLFSTEWDAVKGQVNKTHLNHLNLNLFLKNRSAELEKKLLQLTSQESNTNSELKNLLLNEKKSTEITFYEFATKEIQLLRDQERYGNAQAYETAVNKFVNIAGKNVFLNQINYNLIYDFDCKPLNEIVDAKSEEP